MTIFKALRYAGGLCAAGSVAVAAVRIVTLFQARAFDDVAGAGLIGLAGLAAGGALVWLGFALEPRPDTVSRAPSLSLLRPRRRAPQPAARSGGGYAGLLGWLAVLLGSAWTGLTVMVMGLNAPERTLTLLFATPGAIIALAGLCVVLVASLSRAGRE